MERLDVFGEVLAVFEIELVLAALLGGARGGITVRGGIAQNGGAELFVHQDAGLLLGHAGRDGGLEAVVDHLLGGGDLGGLRGVEVAVPAEHLRLERAAMVEGQDVERLVVADGFHDFSFIFR